MRDRIQRQTDFFAHLLRRVFFVQGDKLGRSITAASDKIFTQTFFQGIDEGLNCGLVGVSITSGKQK